MRSYLVCPQDGTEERPSPRKQREERVRELFKQGTSVWNSFPCDLQVGSDLNSQLDALQAEKEALRKSVNEKECELISAKGLIQEKELLLSQEAEKRMKEVQELQEKLVEKVRRNIELGGGIPSPTIIGEGERERESAQDGRRGPARPPDFPWTRIQTLGHVTCKRTCSSLSWVHPTEKSRTELAAEALGRPVPNLARDNQGSRKHHPGCCDQVGRPPAYPVHQFSRWVLNPCWKNLNPFFKKMERIRCFLSFQI